jgi:hypothetical protein
MKHYLTVNDIESLPDWVDEAITLKKTPISLKVWANEKPSVCCFSTIASEHA